MPGLKQRLSQKLLQKISPQQIQTIKLLEYPAMQLQARIKQEIEQNPVLEQVENEEEEQTPLHEYIKEDDATPGYKLNVPSYARDLTPRQDYLLSGRSLHEYLGEQLAYQQLSDDRLKIARYIIGNLDEEGYLRRELSAIADDLAFNVGMDVSEEELEQVLAVIQSLDPTGVGSRDLRECLELQLRAIDEPTEAQRVALQLVSPKYFDDFSNHRFERVIARLEVSPELFREAMEEVARLEPRPGNLYNDEGNEALPYLIPDFILDYQEGEFSLSLTSWNVPELRINRRYVEMIRRMASDASWNAQKMDKEALAFLKNKVDSAKWFISALRQRQQTLLSVMRQIVDLQRDYFIDGDTSKLRPMILQDIADRVGMDMSTISRVVNSKYVQTHFGTFSLRHFFTDAIPTDSGDDASTLEVKQIVAQLIAAEDKKHPITDEMLMDRINARGFHIARRTIAKYREALGIPVSRLRKEL